RRHAEEMRAVLPLYGALVDQLHPGFMHQSRTLQRVARTLAAQVAVGQPAQFAVDERRKLFERTLVTVAPIDEQTGYICLRIGHGEGGSAVIISQACCRNVAVM